MKYRHRYHAGNFADVHKHATLLALLAALKRKEKGFLYFETHAGRGVYDLADSAGESTGGIARLVGAECTAEPLRRYLSLVTRLRDERGLPGLYPGSPWLAVSELRAQDRAVFVESLRAEACALERELSGAGAARVRVEGGDGPQRLRAALPPPQRRALVLLDPPYEDTRRDFQRVHQVIVDALTRFPTAVMALWYPLKAVRDTERWLAGLAQQVTRPMLTAELRLYPLDSRIALNGSGMLIVNPPYQLDTRLSELLDELLSRLAAGASSSVAVRTLRSR